LTTVALTVPEIWLVPTKIEMVLVTWPSSFQGWFVICWLALATINLLYVLNLIFTHYDNIKSDTKYRKWGGLE